MIREFTLSPPATFQDGDEWQRDRKKLWERVGELQSEVLKAQGV
jgi:hypothetical protein